MKTVACFLCLGILVVMLSTFNVSAQSGIEKKIFILINQYREKKGLKELKYADAVASEARTHSSRMASHLAGFGHGGFDGRFRRFKRKYPRMMGCAENVAYGAKDAEAAVDMWLHSSGHKKNIKGAYTHTGIGVVRNRKGIMYFTQIFIRIE